MADFGLPDAVNAPEPLLDTVGIPWQIIIYHQMSALQVDPFASSIGRQKDLHFRVVPERLLLFHSFFPAHPSVDANHGPQLAPEGLRHAVRDSSACRGVR